MPRLVLTQVRVLVEHEDQTVALDVLVRSGLPPHGGTGVYHEVFWKHRANGRPRASHDGFPFPGGKNDPSIGCRL